jgi:hypothetical protein
MGIDLPRDPLYGGNDSAAGGGRYPALDCRRNSADLGLVARISPDAAAVGCGICLGRALLFNRAWDAALGGAVCRIGAGGAADRDRADVHSGAGLDDGAAEDQPNKRSGPGFRRGGRGHADGSGTYCKRFEPVGIAGGAAGFFVVVVWRGDFAEAQAAY